jgi:hypothetical protein
VTLAACREAEGRRVCLSPKGELASRLHDGSGTGDFGGSGACFLWLLSLHEQRKYARCRAAPANGITHTNSPCLPDNIASLISSGFKFEVQF